MENTGFEGLNVLSTFNGMGCIWLALDKAGIKVNKRYSSEVDKYANIVNDANYPDTVQLGDVTKVDASKLERIDLFVGGSPCQGFSFAGKQLNFEDPRSKLFFEFVRLWEEVKEKNPNAFFLLENVKMKKESQDIISEYMGVEPIEINSALVSAQNRKRLYWTNIPGVKQPEDKGILLKDIVLNAEVFKGKIQTLLSTIYKENAKSMVKRNKWGLLVSEKIACGAIRGRYKVNGVRQDAKGSVAGKTTQMLELRRDGKTNTLTTVGKDNMIVDLIHTEKALDYMNRQLKDGRTHWDFGHNSDITKDKSQCLTATLAKGVPYNVLKDWNCIRKFHPIECERLQTVPDNYTNHVSNTQRYKMLGNGWTVDVIAHILEGVDLL